MVRGAAFPPREMPSSSQSKGAIHRALLFFCCHRGGCRETSETAIMRKLRDKQKEMMSQTATSR